MITSFLIGGVDQIVPVRRVRFKSLRISDELNERNTAQFELLDRAGVYRPQVGHTVQLVWNGAATIFGGLVHDITERIDPGSGVRRTFGIQCVDFTILLDRRIINVEYNNLTLKAVAQDFVATYLAADGVTLDPTMETGPTLEHLVFPDVSISGALNELSELTGFQWYIDYTKVLHLFSQSYFSAPYVLDDLAYWRDLEVSRSLGRYRNLQIVRAGDDISDVQTEEFHGDSKQVSFTTSMPVALAPTVRVNAVAKTVGILNVDAGADWYWNANSNQITQDPAAAKLNSTDTLTVLYQGYFPIKNKARAQKAIADRIAVEGFGTGVYEAVEDAQEINRLSLATDKAIGLLRRYAQIPPTLSFTSKQDGYRAGQILTVNLLKHGLRGAYLIQRVELTTLSMQELWYRVECLDGEAAGGDVDFFRKLVESGKKFTVRDNEVIDNLVNLDDLVGVTDQVTVSTATGQTGEWGTVPEFDEFGTGEFG